MRSAWIWIFSETRSPPPPAADGIAVVRSADGMMGRGELKVHAKENLKERILVFELDVPGAQLPFTSRLAGEQGWPHAFAGRVVVEYKRFITLAMLAGHPVTPSEQVDQAWHLHLVYTERKRRGFRQDCGLQEVVPGIQSAARSTPP